MPQKDEEPRLDIRKMYTYCEKNGIDPNDLTQEQLEQFYIRRNTDEKTIDYSHRNAHKDNHQHGCCGKNIGLLDELNRLLVELNHVQETMPDK